MRLKGLDTLKNQMTSSGIETSNFWLCSMVPQPCTLVISTKGVGFPLQLLWMGPNSDDVAFLKDRIALRMIFF
jgi:hypothetical protein